LYPIVEEKKIYQFLNWLMPGEVTEPEYEAAPARGLPYFFICARFTFAVILLAACSVASVGSVIDVWLIGIAAIILLLVTGSVFMEYKTSAVAAGESVVTMSYGGYRKHIVIINRDKLEYVEDSASQLKRRKRNLSTLKVGVLAPARMSWHRVRNIDISVFDKVKDKLIY
jgi:uncharacterized membrane protein YdbT with pleckstrin-like domain